MYTVNAWRKKHRTHGRITAVRLILVGLLILALFGGCSCAIKKAIDQASVTKRGVDALAEIGRKSA